MALKDLFEGNTSKVLEATELLKVLSQREGQYVWKKFTVVDISMTQLTTGSSFTFKMESADVDLSAVELSYFNGLNGYYNLADGSYGRRFSINDGNFYTNDELRGKATYNASTQVLTVASSMGQICTWYSNPHKISFDYVVSSDAEAYPDGALHTDGYWYERGEGATGIAYGEFTPTANIKTITIQHGLGKIPSAVYILSEDLTPNANNRLVALFNATPIYVYDASAKTFKFTGLSAPVFTENEVTITITSVSSIFFGASIKHHWFVEL